MKRIMSFAAKLAVLVGLGAGLWLFVTDGRSHMPERLGTVRSEAAIERMGLTGATAVEQQLPAKADSCASQTWPHISPECIKGQAEPLKRSDLPVASVEPASSILLRPTRLPEVAAIEPEITGSLPSVVVTPKREAQTRKVVRYPAPAKPSKQAASQPIPRPMLRESKRLAKQRTPATAPEPAQEAPVMIKDPIEFRLAGRGN
jgi:hypothetical protein